MTYTLVFDIETIPDTDTGRLLLDLPSDISDAEVAERMFAKRREETNGSDFLRLHMQKVAAISVVLANSEKVSVWSIGDYQASEKDLIQRFFDGLEKYTPTLVSWNGCGFDLPVLHYRALVNDVVAPRYWESEKRASLILFAIPDMQNEVNHNVIKIPLLGSIILTHSVDGVLPGLKQWPADQRAPVAVPFFSFRIMVGLGLIMLTLVMVSLWLRWRHCLYDRAWFLRWCQFGAPLGFLAILAGWVTTEAGRQPWTVYGLLRTADSVSPSLTGTDVILSLLGYMAVYLIIFPVGFFLMMRMVRSGVSATESSIELVEGGQHSNPIAVPTEQQL